VQNSRTRGEGEPVLRPCQPGASSLRGWCGEAWGEVQVCRCQELHRLRVPSKENHRRCNCIGLHSMRKEDLLPQYVWTMWEASGLTGVVANASLVLRGRAEKSNKCLPTHVNVRTCSRTHMQGVG